MPTWHVEFTYDARECAQLLNDIEQDDTRDLQDIQTHVCGNALTKYIIIYTTQTTEETHA